jgi:peptidoglycan hydrolase-like protein with peptidoglycan-binding domain
MTGTTTILKRKSRGAEIFDLQYLLLFRGGANKDTLGKVDGIFGPKTEAAVKAFQKNQGLSPDGIVGEITWAKLADAEEWPTHFTGKFMRQGDTGDAVEKLQLGLQSKDFYKGKIDGNFGAKTLEAVVKLQRLGSQNTNTEGVVGPFTFVGATTTC